MVPIQPTSSRELERKRIIGPHAIIQVKAKKHQCKAKSAFYWKHFTLWNTSINSLSSIARFILKNFKARKGLQRLAHPIFYKRIYRFLLLSRVLFSRVFTIVKRHCVHSIPKAMVNLTQSFLPYSLIPAYHVSPSMQALPKGGPIKQ